MIGDEQWDMVLKLIASGLTNIDAIRGAGISESSFYAKQKEDLEFSESVKKAEVKFKLKHLANITRASDKGNWQASAWILERKFKREFSRLEYQEQLKDEFAGKTDEELNEMLQKLEEEEREYKQRIVKSKNSTRKEKNKSKN